MVQESDTDSDDDSSSSSEETSLGTFTIDFYWVSREEDFGGTQNQAIHELDDTTNAPAQIGTARQDFVEESSDMDNGLLEDGTMISFQSDCSSFTSTVPFGVCFEFINPVSFPQGRARDASVLTVYKGIQVDSSVITIGTKLYIELLDGVEMPGTEGGFTHDGCVTADNTGESGQVVRFFVFRKSNFTSLDTTLGNRANYTSTIVKNSANCD